jgi:N-acyl-D-aspartate/D-glutamate deacylase
MRHSVRVALLVGAWTATTGFVPDPPRYDLIIRHGTVFDGSGGKPVVADVGIVGDRVIAIGDLAGARAGREEDATGLYVTPGFVSVHDHSAPDAYARPEGLLTQGVTTAIANPDGGGALDIAAQLSPAAGLGLNYGAYIGFNSVWREVVGLDDRRATPVEIAAMRALVLRGLEQGAFGLSSGLDYKPSFWATADEAIAVAEVARSWRTGLPSHERVFPGNGYSSMAGMQETLKIGERAGLMPIITHMKLQGRDHGKTAEAFAMLAHASASGGQPVGVDAYPYTFGATSLEQLLIPAWAQTGGMEAMLERFKDPVLRRKIIAETNEATDVRWGGAGHVYIVDDQTELTEVMRRMGGVSAGEAIVRSLEAGRRRVILRFGVEADQVAILRNPLTVVSCDCGATTSKTGHPRNWGSFPRFLGRYVREQKLVGWSEAVRKMTALPATMIGLSERGYLLPGMIADVTVFDPATVIDRATIDAPTLPSIGIRTVIVNGQIAFKDGKLAERPVGVRLVRSRHEPGRPMRYGIARSLSLAGSIGDGGHIAIRLQQAANAVRPTGSVALNGKRFGGTLVMQPSILQTTHGWASVTGTAQRGNGRQVALTLQIEQADPLAGNASGITVIENGKVIAESRLPVGAVRLSQAAVRR